MASKAVLRIAGSFGSGRGRESDYTVHLSVDGGHESRCSLGSIDFDRGFDTVFDRDADEGIRRDAGEVLCRALLGGGLAAQWDRLRGGATRQDPVRVVLDVEPSELRGLPWELMWQHGWWLWNRPELLIRRGTARTVEAGPTELGPLRVLVVIGTPAHDEEFLAEQELAAMSGALESAPARVHLEVLDDPASAAALSDAIDRLRPHILHFIAHGMPRPGIGGPELVFTPTSGEPWSLTADDVPALANHQPRLVVLNACRSAADPADWVGGVARAFLDAGAGAVVSMQADIESDAAVVFSDTFYARLAESSPVDMCVAAARAALARMPVRTGVWALPVLLTCCEPDAVLPVAFRPAADVLRDILRSRPYAELRRFVGRSEERRQAWWAVDAPHASPAAMDRSVLVISGHSQTGHHRTGKTWLAHWCLLTWFLRGHHIVSVDLAGRSGPAGGRPGGGVRNKDWLTVLRMIRDQATSPDQLCPIPKDAFAKFNAELNQLVLGSARTAPNEHRSEVDEGRGFNDEAARADERKAGIFSAFLDTLSAAAGAQRLVLALDHTECIMPDSLAGELYEGLIQPVAYGKPPAVRLVIVAREESVSPALRESDAHMIGRVQVGDFRTSELIRLARAYSSRLGYVPDEKVLNFLQSYQETAGEFFAVDLFHTLTPHVPQWLEAANALGVRR
ncbi:CHAT domain-containing protein [Streptomyces pristinaespiralis]|uniref:CHAT domain-containing protein n=1 Tax=Streptomyces pristinaespiralis TaxID=38300 RepID=UPI0037BD6BF5